MSTKWRQNGRGRGGGVKYRKEVREEGDGEGVEYRKEAREEREGEAGESNENGGCPGIESDRGGRPTHPPL